MAKKPYYFYGADKQKDIARFQKASSELLSLFTEAKNVPELEKKLGVSRETIRKWGAGQARPNKYDVDRIENVFKIHNGYAPTIQNPERRKNWVEKNLPSPKKKLTKKAPPKAPEVITEDIDTWLDRNFQKRYHMVEKYPYFRSLISERGLKYVMYMSNNKREGIFVKSDNQQIIKDKFLYMAGIIENGYSQVTDIDRRVQIRRIPRVGTMVNKLENIEAIIKKARTIFYSGANIENIENFIGAWFD